MPFSIHEYLRRARHRHDDPLFPVYGKTKKYERMPQLSLEDPTTLDISLATAMQKRHSFPTDGGARLKNLTVSDISNLFGLALRAREDGTRPYPSGGGLYPIETYFIGALGDALSARVCHYDPEMHALADLWPMPEDIEMEDIFPGTVSVAPACIILTGMWGRSGIKYGDFGYYLGMLEAGHIAQNILLTATALDMRTRPIGGFEDDTISGILDIDKNVEQCVYVITVGKSL